MPAGLIEGKLNQANLKPLYFAIEINPLGNIKRVQPVGFVGKLFVTSQRFSFLQ